ncbi:MAG: tetratricopeptide repeat protein [Alphaproteobacteria bacterium]|nr:tetratricopeptide repeat protein [Alphaproteobacteria bacterium]
MLYDKRGLELTTDNQTAVDAFDATIEAFLTSGRDTAPLLASLDETDPNMLMGVCLRGYLMRMASLVDLDAKSLVALATARKLCPGATTREQMHVDALASWCEGDLIKSGQIWEAILLDNPHDILALRLAHNIHFFVGDIWRMRDSMARVMPRWSPEIPGYGYVLGCRAFSLEEAGEYEKAEPIGRRAVEINENDIWAGHAVAHVLEMQGQRQSGIDWINSHEQAWAKRGLFAKHLWWHRSLHYLEMNDFERVLDAYDREFWPEASEDNIDICNSSSMLMRLHMLGVPVGNRWESIAEVSSGRLFDRLRPFNDLHFVMALAMSGKKKEATEIVRSMHDFIDNKISEEVTLVDIYKKAAVPVAKAIISYSDKDYSKVVKLMLEARYEMRPLGGSWAQRDVWVRMFIDAAIKDDQVLLSRALLAERTAVQPTSAPTWSLYANILEKVGDTDAAIVARSKVEKLLAA